MKQSDSRELATAQEAPQLNTIRRGSAHRFASPLTRQAGVPRFDEGEPAPRPRVLVVDDETVIADTLAAILRHAGYEAAVAYDGVAALETCATFLPNLVISDVVMPRMNGIDAAIQIRQRYPNCKILLFSGQASSSDMLEQVRQGGYDFELLSKPIHPKELLSRIASQDVTQRAA